MRELNLKLPEVPTLDGHSQTPVYQTQYYPGPPAPLLLRDALPSPRCRPPPHSLPSPLDLRPSPPSDRLPLAVRPPSVHPTDAQLFFLGPATLHRNASINTRTMHLGSFFNVELHG
ncbi:unnamed protein product [Arctogadus glacialis]